MFSHPFGISWRKALVSIPRLVPDFVLHFTCPEGPQPIIVEIPSRAGHLIPVYVFIPPERKTNRPRHHHRHRILHHKHHENRHGDQLSPDSHLETALKTPEHSESDEDANVKLPVLIDFHGGSFILGSCQEQAPFCARMCRELNCVVISVDYRLGPYAQFPAANWDAEDVVLAVIDRTTKGYEVLRDGILWPMLRLARKPPELDDKKIAISGFSSGGNLALNLALSVKDDPTIEGDWLSPVPWDWPNQIPVLLFYPSLDARLLPDERPRPEGLDPPSGFVERWKIERELMPTYLPVSQRPHPRASPGLADIRGPEGDNYGLHPKAKMLLVLPQLDSLNEQSLVWIDKVRDQGRADDLTVDEVQSVGHGWTQFPDAWISDEHQRLKVEAFRKAREFVQRQWHPEREVEIDIDAENHGDVVIDAEGDVRVEIVRSNAPVSDVSIALMHSREENPVGDMTESMSSTQ